MFVNTQTSGRIEQTLRIQFFNYQAQNGTLLMDDAGGWEGDLSRTFSIHALQRSS